MANDRFPLFSFFYALALLSYHGQVSHPWGLNLATATILVALVAACRPSSVRAFLLLTALQVVAAYGEMPAVNTNRLLLFFVGVTILAASATELARRRELYLQGADLLARFEAPLRAELLIVYVFAGWHKLNTGFLDPASSCGVALYGHLHRALPGLSLPSPDVAAPVAILGTLIVELGLPVLLLIPRTRAVAVVLGWLFHFIVGLAGFYSFSATMMALLLLFTPPSFASLVLARRKWLPVATLVFLVTAVVLAGATRWTAGATLATNLPRAWQFGWLAASWWLFWLYVAPVPVLVPTLLRTGPVPGGMRDLLIGARWHSLVLPACVFLNGLCPYFGLKTETSFAMYSNLRTEGGVSNHLIVRRPLTLAHYQTDLVRIVQSSDPSLQQAADEGRPLPFFELRRTILDRFAAGIPAPSVTYERGGVARAVPDTGADAELSAPISYLERKFLRFREIRAECAH